MPVRIHVGIGLGLGSLRRGYGRRATRTCVPDGELSAVGARLTRARRRREGRRGRTAAALALDWTLGLALVAALAGCEMGLKLAGVKLAGSGVLAVMDHFAEHVA